jgi:hypothetical protein
MMVTVRITQPLTGIAWLHDLSSVRKEWIGELLGRASVRCHAAVGIALRVAFNL